MQPKKSRGPEPIEGAIREFLRSSGLGAGNRHQKVFDAWSKVVGAKLAAHAVPVRLRRDELTVEVDSATHLHELKSFTGESYRKKVNDELGSERVRKLVFRLRG